MTPSGLSSPCHGERGYALMLLLGVLTVAAALFTLGTVSSAEAESERAQASSAALAQAREGLIARAVMDGNRPGSLPCPDLDDDGSSELMAGTQCPAYIGRLPFRTLALPDLRDGFGERLWYAFSATFRDHPAAEPINSDTPATLTVSGRADIAAVIFSAGPPLVGQTSRPSNTVADYLEGDNANGDPNYVSGPVPPNLNDVALVLTRTELMRAVELRIASELSGAGSPPTSGLRYFYSAHHHYPWAAADASGTPVTDQTNGVLPYAALSSYFDASTRAYLENNGWPSLASYTVAENFKPGTVYPQECGEDGSGCLTVHSFNQSQARVAFGSVEVPVCMTNPQVAACPR